MVKFKQIMAQYINKDALVAKIESKFQKYWKKGEESDALQDGNAKYWGGVLSCLNEVKTLIDTLEVKEVQEEPVSEDLEKASKEWLAPQLDKSYANYGETKMMELTHFDWYAMLDAIEFGAKWQKEHLWKPADGDDLPEYEREVVVFTQDFPNDAGIMSVAIGHRPNPEGWDGKSLSTGKVEHYTPKTYDKGRWNIPNVKYWLDCSMPKEIEL